MEELARFSPARRSDSAPSADPLRTEPFSLFPSGESRKRRIDALSGSPRSSPSAYGCGRPVATVSDSPPRAVEIESEPAVLRSPPQMHRWSASAAAAALDGGPVTRTTSPVGPASSHSTGKAARLQDRDAPYGNEQQAANKRYRASPFSSLSSTELFPSLNSNHARIPNKNAASAFTDVYRELELPGFDAVTPEEQYHALKEGSQNLMEALSLSQQNTQECTQTLEESPNMCVMRLVVHRDVDRALTAQQRSRLEQLGLYSIDLDRLHPRTSLGRDAFTKVFDKTKSGVDPIKLSRTHCVVECISNPDSTQIGVYVTDKSTNGIRINGTRPDKNKKIKVKHGDVITMLSGRNGLVLLGYVVEDPHVLAAVGYASGGVAVTRSLDESQHLFHVQEHTLGVLFAAPIVGKDVQGKYHPIAELDIKREYSILQESLIEASKYARRPATVTENGVQEASTTLFQYPNQINVRAMFANTENFRSIVTVGCNALHFSGHGDERHLYFEDGMGLVHPVPHSSLQELFSAGGEATLRLVFVSACSSAPLAQAFVSCGIPHVIGVKSNQKIEDYAAIEFTRSFYLALATGKSVGASFHIAQQAVAKSPNIRNPVEVAQKFLLLPENGDHSEVIFPLVTKAATSAKDLGQRPMQRYPKLWYDDLPAICQGFCNRAVEVYKICLALMLTQARITRLVTITGETGIGKTTVAHAVMNYVAPRISCDGGVKLFSVAKLAIEQLDRSIATATGRRMDATSMRCDVLPTLETTIREHLKTVKGSIELQSKQLLLVLDGCDHLLKTPERRDRFRLFLSDLLTNHASLKIMITARTSISTNGAVAGHGERVYTLSRFSSKMAAKLLLSLVSRPIRLEEVRKAQLNGSTSDKMDLIASHPALLATQGIPQRVADLAGRLNEVHMDDIPVDMTAIEPME